uniref:Uncharacterized protein n=1 Tax=Exiguobacterium sp. S3-2 TaxID=1389960 RepID=V9Z8W8_9BACL|nr:hypothetical protein [Exiguobacterium sp. S3-2]AHE40578.1 hypothetical protein [Exiguobacterium sp. S3-2]
MMQGTGQSLLRHEGSTYIIKVIGFVKPMSKGIEVNVPGKIKFMIDVARFDINAFNYEVFHDGEHFRFEPDGQKEDFETMRSIVTGLVY